MSTDREKQTGANTAGQSELIEPLGTCNSFWCNEYECEGKYYGTCRDYSTTTA